MTAPSDMGGRTEFFAPVIRESEEPVFHERWEGRVFGIANFLLPLLGRNADILRFGMERCLARCTCPATTDAGSGASRALLEQAGISGSGEVEARIAGRSAPTRRRISRLRLNGHVTGRCGSLLRPTVSALVRRSGHSPILGTSRPALRRGRFARATTFGCAVFERCRTPDSRDT